MTPRTLQIIALLQQAADMQGKAANLLVQELAEALEREEPSAPEPKKGKADG